MKKVKTTALLLAISIASFATNPEIKGGDHSFQVQPKQSKFEWLAKKVTGEHYGDVMIKSGVLDVKGGKIVGGNFEIDTRTINATDLEGEYKQKLDGHLKSADFFDVEKHPTAKFVITKAEQTGSDAKITGNLTIKGITHEITFPAKVEIKDHTLTATATFDVNRTKWDIKYGSGSFFDGLGDKMIYDDFNVKINLKAQAAH